MILYHGSTTIIDKIDLAKSRPNKDFGLAFYLSEDKKFDQYTEEWAHFVYEHRTEPSGRTLHDFDIVYGPIANDRIGAQITRYKQGYISFEQFIENIQYIKGITFQYAFCTQKAIDLLKKI